MEYVKNLLDWKESGFLIIEASLNSEDIWEKFKFYNPMLVMMEVDLPDRKGMEVAKKIKNSYSNTQIFFLSDNESFEYARGALEIGVQDYIIKKEITKQLLEEKLGELKKSISHGNTSKSIDYFFDRSRGYHQNYNAVLIEQDNYMSVFSDTLYVNCEEVDDEKIKKLCYQSLDNVMLVLKIDTYRHLILTIADETNENTTEFCYRLKNKLYKETGSDFSVFILSEHTRMEESISQYHLIKKMINQKYFCNISSVLNLQYLSEKNAYVNELNIELIEKAVADVDYDTIFREMDERFIEIVNAMDYEAFTKMVRQLLDILKKRDRDLIDIRTGEVFRIYETGDEENWYLVTDAILWMKRKYTQMGRIILNNRNQNYTNEVLFACKYIYEHYTEPDLCVGDIVEYVKVSENRLRTVFKEEVGVNIIQFITDYRVKKAKELLCNRKTKVSDIHMQIGYTTSQYFSRVFKKVNCMTPVEYKKLRYRAD